MFLYWTAHSSFIIQSCPTIKPLLNNRFKINCKFLRLYWTLINCIRILWTVRASAFNQLTIVIDTAQAQLSVPPLRIITYRNCWSCVGYSHSSNLAKITAESSAQKYLMKYVRNLLMKINSVQQRGIEKVQI